MIFWQRVDNWLKTNRQLACLLVFLISLIIFFWFQAAPVFPGPDAFYHAKMAELTAQAGPVRNFSWLPFTVLAENYADHHLLYHLLAAPWAAVLPPLAAVKIVQAIMAAAVLAVFCWLLGRLGVARAFYYSLALFVSQGLVFRLSLVKAQPFSLIICFLAVYAILAKRYFWLAVLAFFYVWSYGGWFLLGIFGFCYLLAGGWEAASEKNRLAGIKELVGVFLRGVFSAGRLKVLAAISIGWLFGLIINPYFPNNLNFYWFQVVRVAWLNFLNSPEVGVGAEWYPYGLKAFFVNSWFGLVFFLPAVVLGWYYRRRLAEPLKFLFLLSLFFLGALVLSRRNIEYFIPFGVLFGAAVFSALGSLGDFQLKLRRLAVLFWPPGHFRLAVKLTVILPAVALVFGILGILISEKKALSTGLGLNYLKESSEFLKQVSQPGEIVFHSDWDDFPALFYYNSKNRYLVGLDPRFSYFYDPDRYQKWREATLGGRAEQLYQIVKRDFQASYLVVTKDHRSLIKNLDDNFYFQKIHQDGQAIVYRVN